MVIKPYKKLTNQLSAKVRSVQWIVVKVDQDNARKKNNDQTNKL